MAYTVKSMTSGRPGPGAGSFFNFSSGLRTNANASKIARPVVPMPSRGDFGGGVVPERVTGPNRGDFGSADKSAVRQLGADARRFVGDYNDPTKTGAFQNLMGLANEQTAAQESEVARGARDAASRAGYSGGFSSRSREARRDRMSSLAQTGFAGAAQIRGEALEGYQSASGAFAQAMGDYNRSQTDSNVAFGNALQGAKETNAKLGLSAAEINQRAQEGWAMAKSEHQKLQSQLDSAFNNQLIDAGRYEQMSRSLEAQLAMQQLKLAEEARQFNLTREDSKAAMMADERERARLRNERGVDPLTGRKFGQANPAQRNRPFDAWLDPRR